VYFLNLIENQSLFNNFRVFNVCYFNHKFHTYCDSEGVFSTVIDKSNRKLKLEADHHIFSVSENTLCPAFDLLAGNPKHKQLTLTSYF